MTKKTTKSFESIKLANKYLLVSIFFLVWVLFIDKHSVVKQRGLTKTIHKLETEMDLAKQKYELALETKKDIEENPEQYARDNYYMHRSDETVFVIKK